MKKRNYTGKDVDMLTAGATIVENAIASKDHLSAKRQVWAGDYFQNLKDRIAGAFSNYLGIDATFGQRSATQAVLQLQATALDELAGFKIQLQQDFRHNPPRLAEILRHLGFTAHHSRALKRDQEALIQLLYQFRTNATDELRTEITAAGIDHQYFDRISSYADQLSTANITQETHKGSKKLITEEAITEFNAIYSEVIAITKIAHHFYKGNPNKQAQFSYNKIIKAINAHPHHASTSESNPQNDTHTQNNE